MNIYPELSVATHSVNQDWYKDAIVYQLHVKAFADSNDDGIGDFNGLTRRLDYLQDLGVTALWLQPFYPSPGRDDGYDISDYRRVNPDFGTMADFRRFMAEAKRRDLKVITELVINHTSDQHPWFRRARRSPTDSAARDWYVWSDTDQRYLGTRIIFTDTERSNWAWDPEAGAYYWHRFFSHQPDLNYANPQVFSAIVQVMRRWLDAGVDGFRLDAIPYLCEREGTTNENLPETHDVIRKLRAELDSYSPGTLLLAEANQWPEDVSAYFGDGDECHMAYHFPLMPRIYMAIAQEDRFPITDILRQTPDIPASCQWGLFLRNHDELTLEMVTDSERDYLWSSYAADPRARINLGIRRRLAPLMDNDRRKIELMTSLLLSLPGTPILYYGDEIGMGDNIYLGDRNGVRTPMQWTPDRNGGFSRCDPAKLYLPPIMDAIYGYPGVNVEAQSRSISSLLSWTKRLISVRKSTPIFGRGTLLFVRNSNRAVFSFVREFNGETILCVANLSRSAQAAELELSAWNGQQPMEMIGRTRFSQIRDQPFPITLAPYGFFWLNLSVPTERASNAMVHAPEWATLVLSDGWNSLQNGRTRAVFERDVLPAFLASRRWFAHKDSEVTVRVDDILLLSHDGKTALGIVTCGEGRAVSCYSLPLTVHWTRFERSSAQPSASLVAPVRRANHEGTLLDALFDQDAVASIARQIHAGVDIQLTGQRIEFRPSNRFGGCREPRIERIETLQGEQSNTSVMVEGEFVLKFYRRLSADSNPEFEVGRFLTDIVEFPNVPALLGTVELIKGEDRLPLAIMHEHVQNQGDAWSYTKTYLDRLLDEERVLGVQDDSTARDRHAGFLLRMRQMGRRVGELHAALASRDDVLGFEPEPVTADDRDMWREQLKSVVIETFDRLSKRRARDETRNPDTIDRLLDRRQLALEIIDGLLRDGVEVPKIRHHGDLHLGQILMVKDDVYIVDFEGEPHRSASERRSKAPAARDIAGMMRSIDYAATAALSRLVAGQPEEREKLEAFLNDWRLQATTAFYLGAREASGAGHIWSQQDHAAQHLLRFFLIEKAMYEIGYELANRPDWLDVPLLGAIRALFEEGPGT